MSNEVLIITHQIWVISDNAEAQELKKDLDQLLALIKSLVLAQVVIIIIP